jgi:polysaccharide export outer membrane protein
MKLAIRRLIASALLPVVAASCGSYKQNIMLKPSERQQPISYAAKAGELERDFVIQKNDWLEMQVYTNRGEKLIDPMPELSAPTVTTPDDRLNPQYLVDQNGICKLPMVGEMKLEGLTLRQAEEAVQKNYLQFFKEPFVLLQFANKRVVVLGALGGHVIPLTNQNITLAEVLALAKGPTNDTKVQNIRIARQDSVFQVDLSTIEGFSSGNMVMKPGDIVYAEPVRRPFTEATRDNASFLTVLISLLTLIVVLNQ